MDKIVNKELLKIEIEKEVDREEETEIEEVIPLNETDNNNFEKELKFSEENFNRSNRNTRKYTGLILALAAGIFMTLSMVLVKVLDKYHPFNLATWRYFGTMVLAIPVILYFHCFKKSSPFSSLWSTTKSHKQNWKAVAWISLSCFTGSNSFILRYYSLNYLTVADATVIAFSGPVVVVFLAHFFLNEKCGVVSILIALWTFLGVFAISRPPILTGGSEFHCDDLIGTGLALGGMVFGSICIVSLRKAREIQFSVVILIAGIWGTLQSGLLACFGSVFEIPQDFNDTLLMTGMAALAFFGGLCVTLAIKFEQAGPYALIRSSDILFAFIWQLIFLSVLPDLASIIGALIVITGIFVTAFRKWITTLPDESSTKHMFLFLLY